MMSWMLRLAWGAVEAGGGAARIMSPLPSAPRPLGPHAFVGRCGRDFPHRRDPRAHSWDGLCSGYVICGSTGRGFLVNDEHPHPSAKRLVCARVCAGGGAVSPHSLETGASSEPGSWGWVPFPRRQGKMDLPLTHPKQVLETSAPPKGLQCPQALFSLSPSSQKTFLIFPVRIHCLFALLITSNPTHIFSASP